jgi:hypothetical protein
MNAYTLSHSDLSRVLNSVLNIIEGDDDPKDKILDIGEVMAEFELSYLPLQLGRK